MIKEYKILNYFNMRTLFMGIGLSHILINTRECFLISIILGTILGYLTIKFINLENRKHPLNILVSSIFLIIAFFILNNMISTLYLTEMPFFISGIPFLLLILYTLNKKEIVIYRLTNIIIVINILLFVFACTFLIPYFSIDNITYTNPKTMSIIVGAIEYTAFSVVPIYVTKDKKFNNISLTKTYLLSSLTMSIWFILTYGILGDNLIRVLRYPEYIILKRISFMGFLENIENIICFMWIFDLLMFAIANGNNIKNNLTNPKLINLIIPIVFFLTSFMEQYYEFILNIYEYAYIIVIILFITLFFTNKKTSPSKMN